MPGFDGTGPFGQGPRTGGGFGYCPPFYAGPVVYGVGRGGRPRGGGRGRAFGGGRGWRYRYWQSYPVPSGYDYAMPPQMSTEQELAWLKEQSQLMQQQLDDIHARIEELTSEQKQA